MGRAGARRAYNGLVSVEAVAEVLLRNVRVKYVIVSLRNEVRVMMPKVGFEPTRGNPQRFLRPSRIPFRHFGVIQ